MANVEFGTGKTVIILSIVAACFAVLWPKIFYPMFTGSINRKPDTNNVDGCCDVMFETDINAIKIMNDLCGSILIRQAEFNLNETQAFQQGKLSKDVINTCRSEVMNICGIDIAEFLNKKEKIGHSYKQMLDEIRSFNISFCLRHHFGVNPGLLGAPRRMRLWSPTTPRHLRQERPLHFRPEIIHPALREKGRAIPQSHVVPKISIEKEPGRPIPGMRPPMGGAGHVVPPPKVGGTISVIMPIYTVGIILFFIYTVMKIFSRKTNEDNGYKNFHSDPEFRRVVFSEDYSNGCAARIGEDNLRGKAAKGSSLFRKTPPKETTRLDWKDRDTIMSAITGLLAEVDQQLYREGETQNQYSTELKGKKNPEESCTEEIFPVKKASELSKQADIMKKEVKNGHLNVYHDSSNEAEDTKPKVKVMGMELMAECEGGQKWSRPATPNLGVGGSSRSTTPIPPPYSPEPQNIFLEGALPQQSQLLVTDSKTQTLTLSDGSEPEPPVILSSKMTLSLISLDAALPEENIRHNQTVSQSQVDVRSECDDNLETADSTLLDINSGLIDETGENEYESLGEQEEMTSESINQQINQISEDKPSPNYTAATSEKAEAGLELDFEDTAADVSNLDVLDITEDREALQNENIQLCNGNSKEAEEPLEIGDSQQQVYLVPKKSELVPKRNKYKAILSEQGKADLL